MYAEHTAVAAEAALRAGAIQKARYGQAIEVSHKGEINLVTEVDRACEAEVLRVLRSAFPAHDIVTEETDLEMRGSRYVWFVDPLDGTTNFAHGYPCFACSVALTVDGAVVSGAVYDPLREELFTAERGAGAFLNGRRLRVSSRSRLIDALLVTGFPYDVREDLPGKLRLFNTFMGHAQAVRRDGAAAIDLAYLAAGRIDGFWEERLEPWDMMAGILMIEEAGGRVTRFDGSAIGPSADEVLASNGPLHEP
ncbi:MAG TPA: inositol monophosphatase family protein, partial [Vicinamibacteria bacterium]